MHFCWSQTSFTRCTHCTSSSKHLTWRFATISHFIIINNKIIDNEPRTWLNRIKIAPRTYHSYSIVNFQLVLNVLMTTFSLTVSVFECVRARLSAFVGRHAFLQTHDTQFINSKFVSNNNKTKPNAKANIRCRALCMPFRCSSFKCQDGMFIIMTSIFIYENILMDLLDHTLLTAFLNNWLFDIIVSKPWLRFAILRSNQSKKKHQIDETKSMCSFIFIRTIADRGN